MYLLRELYVWTIDFSRINKKSENIVTINPNIMPTDLQLTHPVIVSSSVSILKSDKIVLSFQAINGW